MKRLGGLLSVLVLACSRAPCSDDLDCVVMGTALCGTWEQLVDGGYHQLRPASDVDGCVSTCWVPYGYADGGLTAAPLTSGAVNAPEVKAKMGGRAPSSSSAPVGGPTSARESTP
jgi:hypothetical protein